MPPDPINLPETIPATLNAKISVPIPKPSRPVAVVSSKLARNDMLNKKTQYDQLTQDIQSQRQNVQQMQARKKQQQTVDQLIQRTPPVEPTDQIDTILKNLSDI